MKRYTIGLTLLFALMNTGCEDTKDDKLGYSFPKKSKETYYNEAGDITREEELFWFNKDRQEDVDKNISPALSEKKVVLVDRYYYSTAAYQGALGLNSDNILRDNESFAPIPDRAYIFTAPPKQCLKRIEDSRDSYSSFEKLDYLINIKNTRLKQSQNATKRKHKKNKVPGLL